MTSLKQFVYDSIKSKIISQHLKPGESLNEKSLMEEYDIGKTPLREVFIRLQEDGLIRRFPRSGTIVAPIDYKELQEVMEIRLPVELRAAELAAQRITPRRLRELENKIDIMEKACIPQDIEKVVVNDSGLHTLVYEATENSQIVRICSGLQTISARFWFMLHERKEDILNQVAEWKQIAAALERHDKAATRELLEQHIVSFVDKVKNIL